jgi:hypothetical protein
MKMIGEPDAGNPHVRFDEGAQEPSLCGAPASYSTRQNAASVNSVSSLAWCILTLFVYQEPIGGLKNRLATIISDGRDIRNNATLATAILALKCGEMIHPFEVLR